MVNSQWKMNLYENGFVLRYKRRGRHPVAQRDVCCGVV